METKNAITDSAMFYFPGDDPLDSEQTQNDQSSVTDEVQIQITGDEIYVTFFVETSN